MAGQASLLQEGVDRFNDAVRSIDVQRIQKQIQARRRSFERQLTSGRKNIEKRTRKEVTRLRTEIRRNPLFKRARSAAGDAAKQIESGVGGVLGLLQIASRSDLQRVDRKVAQINKKLKDLERIRKANGGATHI
ncbi:MAG: hypothetical protein V3U03_01155 [Myxococcota bacterium]